MEIKKASKCQRKSTTTKKDSINIDDITLTSGNTDYIKQNLEFMEFIQTNKCKTVKVKYAKK